MPTGSAASLLVKQALKQNQGRILWGYYPNCGGGHLGFSPRTASHNDRLARLKVVSTHFPQKLVCQLLARDEWVTASSHSTMMQQKMQRMAKKGMR